MNYFKNPLDIDLCEFSKWAIEAKTQDDIKFPKEVENEAQTNETKPNDEDIPANKTKMNEEEKRPANKTKTNEEITEYLVIDENFNFSYDYSHL